MFPRDHDEQQELIYRAILRNNELLEQLIAAQKQEEPSKRPYQRRKAQ